MWQVFIRWICDRFGLCDSILHRKNVRPIKPKSRPSIEDDHVAGELIYLHSTKIHRMNQHRSCLTHNLTASLTHNLFMFIFCVSIYLCLCSFRALQHDWVKRCYWLIIPKVQCCSTSVKVKHLHKREQKHRTKTLAAFSDIVNSTADYGAKEFRID